MGGWRFRERGTDEQSRPDGRTTTRVFTLSPGGALPCSRHPRGKGERWHGDILPYNWNTFRKQREREERRERDIPLFEKDLREMDPSSVEREGRERRIAGEYRVRCRSSTMRMAGWERAWAPCQISLNYNTGFQVRQIRLSESEMRPKTNGVISNTKQSHRSHPRLRSFLPCLVLSPFANRITGAGEKKKSRVGGQDKFKPP